MNSPFPGMDPYLEQHWGDVHATLMVYMSRQLNRRLPEELIARIHETVSLEVEMRPERHIEIIDAGSGNRVVTVIELLSPANKSVDAGRAKYFKKQAEYIQGGINLVEIDLLRAGAFVLAMPEERWPLRHQAPYKVCIRRVRKPETAAGIGISLRDPLPNIPIPLRPADADAALQLQTIIADCYRDGRYANIDYSVPPIPPLDAQDAAWAEQRLHEQGRRK